MIFTNSKLIFIAMLAVLSTGCASHSAGPGCAPVSSNYPDTGKREPEYYRVKKDDTLYAISLLFDLDYGQLARWNQITPPSYTIRVGQKIRLSDPTWENNPSQVQMDAGGEAPRTGTAERRSRAK